MNRISWVKPAIVIGIILLFGLIWAFYSLFSASNQYVPAPDDMHMVMVANITDEKGFLLDMIPVLEDGARAENAVLADPTVPQNVRNEAQTMLASNMAFTTELKNFYAQYYGAPYSDADVGDIDHMIRGSFAGLSGNALATAFLSDSIQNNQHELDLLALERKMQTHPGLDAIANNMDSTQWDELNSMQALLASLNKS